MLTGSCWWECSPRISPPPALQESFWLENSERLVDNNCQLLRVLMKLIETNRDTTTLAVACHDLSQFVTYYPHGELCGVRGREKCGCILLHFGVVLL